MSERVSLHRLAYPGDEWTPGRGQREGTTESVRRLHMTSGLDVPNGLRWQCSDSASSYSVRGLAVAASAFAITASARSIAARSSSLFQVSTCSPSSYDSSVASCARETNSRSAAMASESSLASASLREDCVTSLTPSYCNHGSSGNIVTKDDHCNCQRSHVRRWTGAAGAVGSPISAAVKLLSGVEFLVLVLTAGRAEG